MRKGRILAAAGALAAAAGLTACNPVGGTGALVSSAPGTAASAAPAAAGAAVAQQGAPGAAGTATGPGAYALAAMPAGTVTFQAAPDGALQAQVSLAGLTPGSSHAVIAEGPSGPSVQFTALTAGAPSGQAAAVLTAEGGAAALPAGSRLVILNGTAAGGQAGREPIAETAPLPAGPQQGTAFPLKAVEVSPFGTDFGTPQGQAAVSYNPYAKTLTVTVSASGLTPGPHAAHIHAGSCSAQGPVQHMLADFTADSNGRIDDESRTVAGVTAPPPAAGWYLNLHQGTSSSILDDAGNPAAGFRPLLCTDIASPASSTPAASASGTGSPASPPPACATPAAAPSTLTGTHF